MRSLYLRITLSLLLVVVASALILSWAVQTGARRHFEESLPRLLEDVTEARRRLDAAPEDRLAAEVAALRTLRRPLRLLPAGTAAIPAPARAAIAAGRPGLSFHPPHGTKLYLPVRDGRFVLVMGPLRPPSRRVHDSLLLAVGAILVIICGTGLLVAGPLVRRLRRLERTAQRITDGDLTARADVSSRDAVGSLAARFNAMADRVQALLEAQSELLQAVSHELRTPIARLRFGLQMLEDAPDDADRTARARAMEQDLDELDACVEELLLFVRVGDRARALDLQPVTVAAEAQELIDRLPEPRPELRLVVEAAAPGARALADGRYLRRALGNVLANAVRYARSTVVIRITRQAEGLEVAVEDDGPGVPAADRERVFEPFARLDDSRSRASGGHGLGLAIVRRILTAHGGSAVIEDTPGGGARVVTRWPIPAEDTQRDTP